MRLLCYLAMTIRRPGHRFPRAPWLRSRRERLVVWHSRVVGLCAPTGTDLLKNTAIFASVLARFHAHVISPKMSLAAH